MKKCSLKKAEMISFIAACILGTLFHFIYEWSGEHPAAALFFPVNESTWEHLKLIFFPILILSIVEYFLFGIQYDNFVFVKFLSIIAAMVLTVVFFYTYSGILGKNNDVMNIFLYFISMAAAYAFSCRWIRTKKMTAIPPKAGFWGIVVLMFSFFLFTIFPPDIGLFRVP
jgi:hypothetical protein